MSFAVKITVCSLLVAVIGAGTGIPCNQLRTKDGIVCVCNSTYCDSLEHEIHLPAFKEFAIYTSDQSGSTLRKTVSKFDTKHNSTKDDDVIFTVNLAEHYQTILGFGGAVTDAAAINIQNLSPKAQDKLMSSYFGDEGLQYNVIRVPMASCDFSTHMYSYDDHPSDFSLSNFSLTVEDTKLKIPIIQQALNMSQRKLHIYGSPWSAPAWMKTNNRMNGKGYLIGQPGGKYHKTWANYFVRFLQEYKKLNITFWGLTAQNEPTDGNLANFSFQSMGWTPETQRDFIAMDLGPALNKSGFGDIKLMILDDTRLMLPGWAETVFSNPDNMKYVSGIGVHWYEDLILPTLPLQETHQKYPDKFILATEACVVGLPWLGGGPPVLLGSWLRGELYAHSIIEDLNNYVVGWTDWNIALDMEGGPNWVKNFVDSPIIVNKDKDEFYKQPMYYVMGHFSKFLVKGCIRIGVDTKVKSSLEVVAALCPPKSIVFIILNRLSVPVPYHIYDPICGYINGIAEPHSIQTIKWWLV